MKLKDRVGDVVGRLVVHSQAPNIRQANGRQRVRWLCICSCGNEVIVDAGNLNSRHTRSCGCLPEDLCSEIGLRCTHAMSYTKEFSSWRGAKNRCFNHNNKWFSNYGGRGISMYPEWVENFAAFYAHIGPCPEGLTLDRIDNDRGYEPGNVRWATKAEQVRNRRVSVRVEVDGCIGTLAELAEKYKLPYNLVYDRFARQNWTAEKALTTPKKGKHANRV